jgi:hypothetical protein
MPVRVVLNGHHFIGSRCTQEILCFVILDSLLRLMDSDVKFNKAKNPLDQNALRISCSHKSKIGKTKMKKSHLCKIILVLAMLSTGFGTASADDNTDKLIAHARAAAPTAVGAAATVVINGEVVVEGSNGWTCMPDTMPGDRAAICIDAVWAQMMTALGTKAPFVAPSIGISYMLLGEPAGSGVSNSDPYHKDAVHAHDYVETGPHLMIVVPKEMLKGISDDPSTGGPYVMWKDTDYAHIMIPVGSLD